jgi:hypothetical protein
MPFVGISTSDCHATKTAPEFIFVLLLFGFHYQPPLPIRSQEVQAFFETAESAACNA